MDSNLAESNTEEINRELAASSWANMDEMVSEGAGNYCASVSSEDDKGAKCELRRTYRCSKCGAEKKGHVCSAKVKEPASPSPTLGVRISRAILFSWSRPRCCALLRSACTQVKRGDLAARLAARLHGQVLGAPSRSSSAQCAVAPPSSPAARWSAGGDGPRGGRAGCRAEADSECERYAAAADGTLAAGMLAGLPFFRSFPAAEAVRTPAGVALALVGPFVPPI
jgi:hypothetical protein